MATSPEQQGVAPTPNQEGVDIVQHLGHSRYFGFRDFLDRVDHYVTTSAFGYFFTLSGTGHVRCSLSLCVCVCICVCVCVLFIVEAYDSLASSNCWSDLLSRSSCWHHYLCDYGVHHRCQRIGSRSFQSGAG